MALCDILICLDATAPGDGRLELALNLAQANKAHLTAVYALPESHGAGAPPAGPGLPPTVLGPVSPDGARAIGRQPTISARSVAAVLPEAERADIIEQRFREELPLRRLDGEWHMLTRTDLTELIQLAKAADLTILGQYPGDDSDGTTWLRPDDVMIDAGRPVLIVPHAGTFERVGRRVLIAWDGTREANRALHDALPLIGGAEMVTIMHVGAQPADLDRDRPGLERIVRHLGRHGIEAKPEESLHPAITIRDALSSRAADLGADMIVAGAYHHSQLRESLLGGVSRDLLAHMTVPVLMSH
jgi:nucleotide-binding universal stress UspA family protein